MTAGLAAMMRSTLRVLIVEDDARYRQMLATMLRDLDCEPTPAAGAVEALEILASQQVDVIVLDLNMPRIDGMEFLERLRQRDATTPVIILTGVGTLASAQSAIRLGVTEFLTKPCHMGVMEAALDRVRRSLAQRAAGDHEHTRREPSTDDATPASAHGDHPPESPAAPAATATLEEMERQAIMAALARHGGNRSAAAAALGISRRTMHYRLVEYRRHGWISESTSRVPGQMDEPAP